MNQFWNEYFNTLNSILQSKFFLYFSIILFFITLIGTWKTFEKTGKKGYLSIIPFYSNYIFFKIVTKHGWLFIISFIPIVGIFYQLYVNYQFVKKFGKNFGFALGLTFLSPIFYTKLGFDESEFKN